jgi:hypothetical protein
MLMKIKKKKYIVALLAAVIALVIIIHPMFAAAYPSTWDRYTNSSEGSINLDIYNGTKKIMDTYDTVTDIVPGSGEPHGPENQGYPYTTWNIKDGKISKWYKSGYGPFLDYAGRLTESSMETVAAQFNKDNNTYDNADYAYIASTQEDLADAKSVVIEHYTDLDLVPLLINKNTSNLSSTVIRALDRNQVKNAIVVGGGQRLDSMFGIGDSYNILRIGGAERNKTYDYLSTCEENASDLYNIADMPQVDENGIVCDIKDKSIAPGIVSDINTALEDNHFNKAAKIILEDIWKIGDESNIASGEYSVIIGGKNSDSDTNSRFLIVYYLYNTGGYPYGVYQYIGPDYDYDNDPGSGGHVGNPPTAIIDAPDEVVAGERVRIDGSDSFAYGEGDGHDGDPDDLIPDDEERDIEEYRWEADPEQYIHSASYDDNVSSFRAWFGWTNEMREQGIQEYEVNINLRVTDDMGADDQTDHEITVRPPIPTAALNITGTFKENRKITIDASGSECTEEYPITSYVWSITPIRDGDANSVKYSGELNGSVAKDILIKKAGTYRVTITVYNSVGYTATTYQDIVVQQDLPPVAAVNFVDHIMRDPNDSNYGTFTLNDASYSPDDDIVTKRVWIYSYDSNNNGSFDDEIYYVFNNDSWKQLGNYSALQSIDIDSINDGNKTQVILKSKNVGDYFFEIIAKESFGQPTIEEFITTADYRTTIGK